ncbi:MAG: CDP-glucose 4,6-dehydratase, partial [Pirellulaceae bacterium]
MFSEVYRGRRVLVTGGTGFKGSWLCHWLQRLGAHVTCVGLAPATEPDAFTALRLGERIDSVELDVRDAHALQACVRDAGPEIVFHLAAQPIVRIAYRDPKETFDTNVGGVVNLLEAVRRQGEIEACVVITSDKVYENCEWPWGYRESDPLGGYDPYSASKAAVEIVVSSYRRSYFRGNDAKRIATARAGNVIGGGDWSADRIVPDFVRALVADRPLVLRSPAAVRPWQHVLEPLSGYLRHGACLLGPQGEQYTDAWNFGPADDACQPVGTLAELLVRAWGSG